MPDPALGSVSEVFSAPIESFIVALAQGISEAQRQLDRDSLATQHAIDADPAVAGLGIQATWYQFPRVDVQLKVSMSIVEEQTQASTASIAEPRRRIHVQPVSASFQNHFDYTAEASSMIGLSIVPVPGPHAAGSAAASPQLTPEGAQATAFAAARGKFATVGTGVPDPKLRLDVNYNPTNQLWYVMQYDPVVSGATPVIVVVDDRTQKTRIISPT